MREGLGSGPSIVRWGHTPSVALVHVCSLEREEEWAQDIGSVSQQLQPHSCKHKRVDAPQTSTQGRLRQVSCLGEYLARLCLRKRRVLTFTYHTYTYMHTRMV